MQLQQRHRISLLKGTKPVVEKRTYKGISVQSYYGAMELFIKLLCNLCLFSTNAQNMPFQFFITSSEDLIWCGRLFQTLGPKTGIYLSLNSICNVLY